MYLHFCYHEYATKLSSLLLIDGNLLLFLLSAIGHQLDLALGAELFQLGLEFLLLGSNKGSLGLTNFLTFGALGIPLLLLLFGHLRLGFTLFLALGAELGLLGFLLFGQLGPGLPCELALGTFGFTESLFFIGDQGPLGFELDLAFGALCVPLSDLLFRQLLLRLGVRAFATFSSHELLHKLRNVRLLVLSLGLGLLH